MANSKPNGQLMFLGGLKEKSTCTYSNYSKTKSKHTEKCLYMCKLLMACKRLIFQISEVNEKEYVNFKMFLAWLIHQYDN